MTMTLATGVKLLVGVLLLQCGVSMNTAGDESKHVIRNVKVKVSRVLKTNLATYKSEWENKKDVEIRVRNHNESLDFPNEYYKECEENGSIGWTIDIPLKRPPYETNCSNDLNLGYSVHDAKTVQMTDPSNHGESIKTTNVVANCTKNRSKVTIQKSYTGGACTWTFEFNKRDSAKFFHKAMIARSFQELQPTSEPSKKKRRKSKDAKPDESSMKTVARCASVSVHDTSVPGEKPATPARKNSGAIQRTRSSSASSKGPQVVDRRRLLARLQGSRTRRQKLLERIHGSRASKRRLMERLQGF